MSLQNISIILPHGLGGGRLRFLHDLSNLILIGL